MPIRLLLPLLTLAALPSTAQAQTTDVVVFGGTSAGVAAAIQAARDGATVVLIEPGDHIGGLTSGGLGWTDSGNKSVIGGISREFYQRIKRHYDNPAAWKFGQREAYDRYRPKDDAMWTFEPHVAEQIFVEMLREARVPVVKNQRLDRQDGVTIRNNRIESIRMESGRVFSGRMFVDATYEGDLMAAAGVSFTVGRESNNTYGELLNGVQKKQNTHKHRFVKNVDPYRKPGDPSSGLVPEVHGEDPGRDGTGDKRIQAYCFRMCMSNVPENSVPFPKPAGYREQRYELLLRNFEAGDLRLPLKPDMMPNGKTDTNNNCAFSTDYLGGNYDYPEASYDERERIIQDHIEYQQGLMWTLANHPRVPASIRREMSRWGLAKDEFTDSGNWPHQLYIREARRMVSDYVMTELDCRRQRVAEDSVGLGSYNMDSHNVQRYVTADGSVQNEGDVQVSPGGAYLISYRSIVPPKGQAENLLVPVCVSASHIAYGSIRMEPVFMILGQSAATAAKIAMEKDLAVQDVQYAELRKRLLAGGQVLDLPPGSAPRKLITVDSLPGIVVDSDEAQRMGVWVTSTSTQPYVGAGYYHDGDESKGQNSIRFSVQPMAGRYHVKLSYAAHSNRATNVPVTIHGADGRHQKTVNQRKKPAGDGLFHDLGIFRFDGKQPAVVEIGTEGTDGYVIVDALQLIEAKTDN